MPGGSAKIAHDLLRIVRASSAGVKPLEKLAERAIGLADALDEFASTRVEWSQFSDDVQETIAGILRAFEKGSVTRGDLTKSFERLQASLGEILAEINNRDPTSTLKEFVAYSQDPERLAKLQRKFDRAVTVFNTNITIAASASTAISSPPESTSLEDIAAGIADTLRSDLSTVKQDIVSSFANTSTIKELPYIQGASWNPTRVCLPNTRENVLRWIGTWMGSADTAQLAQIVWLSDVAGSGKSAIAHTVSQLAHDQGYLVSSVFFDKLSAERNNSVKLVSTFARDLAGLDPDISAALGSVLDADASLRSASPARQFEELLLRPSVVRLYPCHRPLVIVLDGIDEAWDEEFLFILSQLASRLPGSFRIFITSRPQPDVVSAFEGASHIRKLHIDVRSNENKADLATYMEHRLRVVAQKRRKRLPWPDGKLCTSLNQKSEGLFQWAFTVTDFLSRCTNPDKQLQAILSATGSSTIEGKMDILYRAVLDTCPWAEDEDFVEGYHIFMGTFIAAMEPLSCAALVELHGDSAGDPRAILDMVGALLTGLHSSRDPIRLIHRSLRDYLTVRAIPLYSLSGIEHNHRLAVLCLDVINRDLVGENFYSECLDIVLTPIPDALYYACCFWPVHLLGVKEPTSMILHALRTMFATRLVYWSELSVCMRKYQKLDKLRDWLKVKLPLDKELFKHLHSTGLATRLRTMSLQLAESGRLEEALLTAEESVTTFRQLHAVSLPPKDQVHSVASETVSFDMALATRNPVSYKSDLIESLVTLCRRSASLRRWKEAIAAIQEANRLTSDIEDKDSAPIYAEIAAAQQYLSHRLTHSGRWSEALDAIEHTVALHRQYGQDNPEYFKADLAVSLHNLSLRLSDLGRRTEALVAIKEVVQLHRALVDDRSSLFTPSLINSLNDLSICLSEVGQREDALDAIEESVQLLRDLPPTIRDDLIADVSRGLYNLSLRLSDVGRRQEALTAILEAVNLYRKLAVMQPGLFDPELAVCLNNMCNRLSEAGRWEEALSAIQEAVDLRRELAEEQPTPGKQQLAESLNNLSNQLAELGRWTEALYHVQEATSVYRNLAEDRPAVFNPALALTLHNLALRFSDASDNDAAVSTMEEAIALRRQLADDLPGRFKPDLAHSLYCFSTPLSRLGRHSVAVDMLQEAIRLFREVIREQPTFGKAELKRCLRELALQLGQAGRKEEARAARKEANDAALR